MSDTRVSSGEARAPTPATVALRFEVAVLPVADVDRAKAFYERLGWRLDADFPIDAGFRIVQFTPPGSPASIQFGTGVTPMAPGSVKDLYLVVDDLQAARDELMSRGADVSEIWHGRGGGRLHAAAAHLCIAHVISSWFVSAARVPSASRTR